MRELTKLRVTPVSLNEEKYPRYAHYPQGLFAFIDAVRSTRAKSCYNAGSREIYLNYILFLIMR